MRDVFKLPAYRRLFAAYTINELAVWIGALALAVVVYQRTGSAVGAMGFFLCSQFAPALISPALVARLDRHPPRRVLPMLYAFEAVAFLVLAWFVHRFDLTIVLVLSLLDGVGGLAARSVARAATVSVLRPAGLLGEGNAVTNGAFSICFMAGPAVAGVIVAAGSTVAALLANSVLFGLIAVLLASSAALPEPPADSTPTAGRLRAALAYAWQQPAIRNLLCLQAVALVFFTISLPVEVVFAERTLHAHASGYGWLLSTWGVGAVAGSLIYGRWHRLHVRVLIAIGAGGLGLGFLVMAAAGNLAVAVVGSAVAGLGNGVQAVAARTALQEFISQSWMGLVMGLNESLAQGMPGVGIVLGGVIAALASPRAALGVAGIGALVVTAASWVVLRPAVLRRTETLA